MIRTVLKIDSDIHNKTIIMLDCSSANEILPYILTDGVDNEFKEIRSILKQGLRNKEKYCKADVSNKAMDVFEMRFTRNGRNDRIYCKEIRVSSKRIIIMIMLYIGKKTQKINKNTKNNIEIIGGYDYGTTFLQ